MHPILFDLGEIQLFGEPFPLQVGSYGTFLVLALAIGTWLGTRFGRRLAPTVPWADIVVSMIATGVLTAKFWGILLVLPAFLAGEHSWASGLVSGGHWMPGAVAGLGVGAWRLRRHGVPLGEAMNTLVLAVPVAHATARLGCLLAGCCHGAPTELPWGIVYPTALETAPHSGHGPLGTPLGIPLHPSPIYEMLAEVLNFTLCWRLFRREPKPWQVLALWATLYGSERFLFEFLRGGEAVLVGPLTSNQWIALGIAGAGVLGLVISRDRARRAEPGTARRSGPHGGRRPERDALPPTPASVAAP